MEYYSLNNLVSSGFCVYHTWISSFLRYIVLCKKKSCTKQKFICFWSFRRYFKLLQYFRVLNYYLIWLKLLYFFGCLNVLVVSILCKQNSECSLYLNFFLVTSMLSLLLIAPSVWSHWSLLCISNLLDFDKHFVMVV